MLRRFWCSLQTQHNKLSNTDWGLTLFCLCRFVLAVLCKTNLSLKRSKISYISNGKWHCELKHQKLVHYSKQEVGLMYNGRSSFWKSQNVSQKKLVWEPPIHNALWYILHGHGENGIKFEIQNSQILLTCLKRYTSSYVWWFWQLNSR